MPTPGGAVAPGSRSEDTITVAEQREVRIASPATARQH
jgi:hypothetical protein